jgi:peptide/nickel transport system substrate-binding protein
VVAEAMRKVGFKVDVLPLDWGTLSQRRNNKGPVDLQKSNTGGWNLFITVATALDASTPLTNPYLATPCPNDVAGFPCDEELQRLRRSWWESTDEAERARLADQIQGRARGESVRTSPGFAISRQNPVTTWWRHCLDTGRRLPSG